MSIATNPNLGKKDQVGFNIRKLQFSELNFQLNNHSTNRCYMETNKPCNSGFSLPFFPLADRCSHFL